MRDIILDEDLMNGAPDSHRWIYIAVMAASFAYSIFSPIIA